jgi:nitrite reductase/ring-hydroxylating ferredoxin subunit
MVIANWNAVVSLSGGSLANDKLVCKAKQHSTSTTLRGVIVEGFVVNFGGRYYAYINYCIHAGTPLDWWPNEFFNNDRQFLTCGTHGSLYDPNTGKCAGGRIVVTAGCDPQDDRTVGDLPRLDANPFNLSGPF